MSLADILIVLGFAAIGGVAAWATWQVSLRRRKRAAHTPAQARKPSAIAGEVEPEPSAGLAADGNAMQSITARREPAPPRASFLSRVAPVAAASPPGPDPDLVARLDGLKGDIATLAQAQLALLEGRSEHESRLLAEMRAIAATPELSLGLARVETTLGALGDHIGTLGSALAQQAPATADSQAPDDAARDAPQPNRQIIGDAPAPRTEAEPAQRSDDSLVSMLDHARGGSRGQQDAGLIGRRTIGPVE